MLRFHLLLCLLPISSTGTVGDFCIPDGSEQGFRKIGWRCGIKCVPRHYVCDGFVDCSGGEDEENQACAEPCPAGWLKCGYGNCVQPTQLCDGSAHCPGREDETAVACAWRQYLFSSSCPSCTNMMADLGLCTLDQISHCIQDFSSHERDACPTARFMSRQDDGLLNHTCKATSNPIMINGEEVSTRSHFCISTNKVCDGKDDCGGFQEERSGCGGPDQQWPFYLASIAIVLATFVSFFAVEIFSCPNLATNATKENIDPEKMMMEIILDIVTETCQDKKESLTETENPEEIFKANYLKAHLEGKNKMEEVSTDHFIECYDCTNTDCSHMLDHMLEVEKYIHGENSSDVSLCIKNQLGTSRNARKVMDIYENGFFRQIKMKIKSHSVFGPILNKITILEPLMNLSTIISYCLDFGLDIFFCLQFYSMSLLKTKGSSESEMFYAWQDWFEYYIPLSSFFRTFAFLSLGIMTLSHIIMFLRAVSSQKMRCHMGYCSHHLKYFWIQNTSWTRRGGILLLRIIISPVFLFSFPLMVIKYASIKRRKRKLYERVPNQDERKSQSFKQKVLSLEESLQFVEKMKIEQESIEVNFEAVPQVVVLLLLFISLPLQGQVLAGNQVILYFILIAKIAMVILKHSKTCFNQMQLERNTTLGVIARIVLQISFFLLLTSRLVALVSCLLFSSLVPDLGFYHKYVIAWSNWTTVHPNYPPWKASTLNISKELSLPTDKYGAFVPSLALTLLPVFILMLKVGVTFICVRREKHHFAFLVSSIFVPIKHVNMSTRTFGGLVLIFVCENAILLSCSHVWYGSGITNFINLLNADMTLSYTSIVKFFYLLFPQHLTFPYLHGFLSFPVISMLCSCLSILLLKVYYKSFHLWKNVEQDNLLLVSTTYPTD